MCGIAGIITTNPHLPHDKLSYNMIQQLQHRGPDFSSSKKIDTYCSLSHTRLKIIDLSDNANQPMYCYQKRFVIIFNGEIYNYRYLRSELQRVAYKSTDKSYPFQTKSDTEVILAAYHRWGEDCVTHLDGMFAFAIYDIQKKQLFVARDRQGKKPLYYFFQNNTFAFASEIRAILHSSLSSKKLDNTQLYDYFQYQSNFTPYTLISDIYLLESAHILKISIDNDKLISEKKRYWKPIESIIRPKDISYDEVKKRTRDLLFSAVEKRLVSDVPLGAFLSGGIDSSAIVGIMKKYLPAQVNTFHVTSNISEFSEKKYAQTLSETYQTQHHNIVLNEKEILDLVSEALTKIDYPSGDGINTYIVSKATKNAGITVALSGLGGDELFAGYPQFKIIKKLHSLSIVDIPKIRKFITHILPDNLFSSLYRLKILMQSDSLNASKLFPFYRHLFSDKNIPLIISQHPNSFFNLHVSDAYLLKENHVLSYISLLEMNNYMQSVLLRDTDQMSMANALEVRAPFLDTTLLSFVLALPDEYKYPQTPKKLLTDSLSDVLPKDIIQRKKMGFVLPFKTWMRRELKDFCNKKILALAEQPFVQKKKLLHTWDLYQKRKHNRWWMFWHLIVLQHWIEKNNINTE